MLEEGFEINFREADFEFARFDLRQIHKIVDDPEQPLALFPYRLHELLLHFGKRAQGWFTQRSTLIRIAVRGVRNTVETMPTKSERIRSSSWACVHSAIPAERRPYRANPPIESE